MSTVVKESGRVATTIPDDVDEAGPPDVVGLRIPRRRLLATVQIEVDARELPRRRPHVSFASGDEEEPM
jgi:hypothetical protein